MMSRSFYRASRRVQVVLFSETHLNNNHHVRQVGPNQRLGEFCMHSLNSIYSKGASQINISRSHRAEPFVARRGGSGHEAMGA